jgi:hypothetical protein
MQRDELIAALDAAGAAHHEFETVALEGERHELWAGFYAAYVLGRLGDFIAPSALSEILESTDGEPWSEAAADNLLARLRG